VLLDKEAVASLSFNLWNFTNVFISFSFGLD